MISGDDLPDWVSERVLIGDPADRQLVEECHPAGYVNPTPAGRYNLVAIGGGAAGLVSAGGAGLFGGKAALIERGLMGGDCLTTGCVPSKALLRAARAMRDARGLPGVAGEGQGRGVAAADGRFEAEFTAAMERMRGLRARIAGNDSVRRFREHYGIDVFLGEARFVGRDEIEVGGRRLKFRRAVIATGGRPIEPELPGLREAGFETNETLFRLTRLPQSLIVIGGGAAGCELAQGLRRFGCPVTILNAERRLLPREAPGVSATIEEQFASEGIRIFQGVKLLRAGVADGRREIAFVDEGVERVVAGEVILVAIGRRPNIEGLGLEAAGVGYDGTGVLVDDHLRTSNRRIYAAGDVCSPLKFTHAADAMARIVVRNALFLGRQRMSRLVMPWATFTDPEVAHVGMRSEEALAAGSRVRTLTTRFSENDRAILDGEESGMVQIHYDQRSTRLLGGTIVARHAGEMIGELGLAITSGLKLGHLAATIHPYPTLSESLRHLADGELRQRMPAILRRLLRRWLALNR